MRITQTALLILLLLISPPVLASEPAPFNVVQRLFAAMSANDEQAMKDTGTHDFHLLEVGEVWDMADLIVGIKRGKGKFHRRNYFKVIRTVSHNDIIWVSYWNKADFTFTSGNRNSRAWLESAVLVKINGDWKIQMLHSTRMDHKPIPKDVMLEEYINGS